METERQARTVGLQAIVGPALNYASHIAKCTETLIAAMDRFDEADEAVACADTGDEEEIATDAREEAALDIRESRRAIRNAIYEFRKRLPEVQAALQPNASHQPRRFSASAAWPCWALRYLSVPMLLSNTLARATHFFWDIFQLGDAVVNTQYRLLVMHMNVSFKWKAGNHRSVHIS